MFEFLQENWVYITPVGVAALTALFPQGRLFYGYVFKALGDVIKKRAEDEKKDKPVVG